MRKDPGSCPDRTLAGGACFAIIAPRKRCEVPGALPLCAGRGIAEAPWARRVRQCLITASPSRLWGSSFHHLGQEVTHLSTGAFEVPCPQISSNFPHDGPKHLQGKEVTWPASPTKTTLMCPCTPVSKGGTRASLTAAVSFAIAMFE